MAECRREEDLADDSVQTFVSSTQRHCCSLRKTIRDVDKRVRSMTYKVGARASTHQENLLRIYGQIFCVGNCLLSDLETSPRRRAS